MAQVKMYRLYSDWNHECHCEMEESGEENYGDYVLAKDYKAQQKKYGRLKMILANTDALLKVEGRGPQSEVRNFIRDSLDDLRKEFEI